jgi:hypothetical protein
MSSIGEQLGGAAAIGVAAAIGFSALADHPDAGMDDRLIGGAILILIHLGLLLSGYLHDRHEEAEQRRRDLQYVRSGMAAIDSMTGVEFENCVAAHDGE